MSGKIAFALVVALSVTSVAADLFPGSRAMGLGGAFSALGDDAWGAWWNPASILRAGRPLIGTEYTSLYPNMDEATLHYAALSYLQPLSRFVALAVGAQYLTTADLYSEGEARLTFAFRPGYFPVSLGFTGRYLFRRFESNEFTWYDPLFAAYGMEGKGIGLDAGLQAELGSFVTIAGTAMNLLQPDLGLETEEAAPMRYSLGAAFYPRFITPSLQVDYSSRNIGGDMDLTASAGFEKWLGQSTTWGLRAGYTYRVSGRSHEISAGFSARTEGSIPMQFDYAVSMPLNDLSSTWGRHRVGLSFRLGGDPWSVTASRIPLPPLVDRRTWLSDTDLYQVDLWSVRDVQSDNLTIAQYDALPLNSTVQMPSDQTLFAYFPVTSTFIDEDIRELTASFRVPRSWIEENGLEVRLLRMYRVLDGGELERMVVAPLQEDSVYYYYEAPLDCIGDLLVTCRPAELVMIEPRTVYGEVDSVDVLEASLSFRVSKLWMDENRIDPLTIGLSRVIGGVPLDVEVRMTGEDLEYCFYETNPIDLFQFVIVATEREGLPVSTIYFDYAVGDLREDQLQALDAVVATLRANPGVFVSVEGHADSDGVFTYNEGLSETRALNVAEYLEDRLAGVDVEIAPSWYGERRPAALNTTDEGRSLNRRVEIVILRGGD
jgi:PGF-pre-PGF domain-containing protein